MNALAGTAGRPHANRDVRVDAPATVAATLSGRSAKSRRVAPRNLAKAVSDFRAAMPDAEVSISPVTGAVEMVSAAGALTAAAPGRSGFEIVREFLRANAALYGLGADDIANLHFIGESVSAASGLRMVRVEQTVNRRPVFQSETRFTLDREGRIIRSVGLMIPDATATAAAPVAAVSAQSALVAAMASVDLALDAGGMALAKTAQDGSKTEVTANDARIAGPVPSELVYFPIAPGVLVPAWSQVSFTTAEGDWLTLVDASSGALLWRKNIRAHASTEDAHFGVYVQADGTTPADNPAPQSPTTVTPGSGTQPPAIARTTVSMFAAQNPLASPNGWIADGGSTTTGNNVDAYLDRNSDNAADAGALDLNGRPTGNLDGSGRNRDFLGTGYAYAPPPVAGNPESGTALTDAQAQRGAVTQLFYLTNWYHDRLHALGFDAAAGNFQTDNFGGGGLGNDAVLAEAQDGAGNAATNSNRNNANFSTPPDGGAGRMQMYIFDGPTVDRDGSLDAEIVLHELTHGLSNRLIGNGSGLIWDVGGGMGEGWSDFYALALLNHTNADDPDARFAAGGYATYKLASPIVTDNYLYGIRRFPYSTDNAVNPLTWADVDDVTNSLSGGIAPSLLNFNGNGAGEVHNIGEIWCNTLWEVRSRIIADPAGANGDVPSGNDRMLQIVTDGMKMTPINPSFIDARDAIIAADAATNAAANELAIWQGFADRGLGYKAVAPFSRMFGYIAGHVGIGESFDIPYLDVQSVAIDDSLGNNNGAIDPHEPVRLTVKLKNPWRRAAFGVASATATLTSATPGVTITIADAVYPAIPALGSADGSKFQVLAPAGATAGQALHFTITVASALGTRAVDFTLRVGTPNGNGAPITYSVSPGLAIPDVSPRGVVSTQTVADDFEIADLNLRLDSLTHTAVGDLTVLLRGPNGLGTDLITALGGGSDGGPGDNFTNTVIDDQATGDLLLVTAAAAPFTGSWRPIFNNTSWSGFGFPVDPNATLARYNGLSTKGDWKVLVSDQGAADTGTLNSWSLIVTPRAFSVAPFSDTAPPAVAVTPSGTATNVAPITFTLQFSEPVTGLSAAGIVVTGGVKGALAGSGDTYTLPVTPSAEGPVTCEVVASAAVDPSLNGNTASNVAVVTFDTLTGPPLLTSPASSSTFGSPVNVMFSLPEAAMPGTVQLSFSGAAARTLTLAPSQHTSGLHSFSFDPGDPTAATAIVGIGGGANIPDGVYSVTLSYQDALGNPVASAVATGVTIDTVTQAPTLIAPASNALTSSPIVVAFSLPETAFAGSVTLVFTGAASRALTLAGAHETSGSHGFSFDPAAPLLGGNVAGISGGTDVPDGLYTVSVSYRDAVGNLENLGTSTTVRIDTTAPMLTPPANAIVEATSPGGATVNYGAALANDAVGVASLTYSQNAGTVFPLGDTMVTVTATDAANNTSMATFTVTVRDTTPPSASVAATVAVAAGPTGTAALGDLTPLVTRSDAVGVVSIVQTPAASTVKPLGSHPVSFAIKDAANNLTTVQTMAVVGFAAVATPTQTSSAPAGRVVKGTPSGAPAPGAGTGGLPADATIGALFTPAISDFRDMAARATLLAGRKRLGAIYVEDGAGVGALVAFQGKAADGLAPGVTFKSFRDPLLTPDGAIAFGAKVKGLDSKEDEGVWTDAFGGTLQPILQEGHDVPGLSTGNTLKSVTSISLRDGEMIALLKLNRVKGQVTAGNDVVLLRLAGGAVPDATVLLRTGDTTNGPTALKISAFQPGLASKGQGRTHADGGVIVRVKTDSDGDQLVAIDDDGTKRVLLSTGTEDPTLDAQTTKLSPPAMAGSATALRVKAKFPPATRALESLVFSATNAPFAHVESVGDTIPGGTATFARFADPVVNDGARAVFLATLKGDGITSKTRSSLWEWDASYTLSEVIRSGTPASGPDGVALAETVWKSFTNYALPDGPGAGVIFTAQLAGSAVTAKTRLGLWAEDRTGLIRLLLRGGQPVAISPGVTKTLAKFKMLDALPGSFGSRRSYNSTGSVAVLATFTDKTQALLRIDIP